MTDAERILEEYKWRESKLQSDSLTSEDIEPLLNAVAMACRSELMMFNSSDLNMLNQKSKHVVFEALLDLLENIPCREPILHTFEHPIKGTYFSGWKHEQRERWVNDFYTKRLGELKKQRGHPARGQPGVSPHIASFWKNERAGGMNPRANQQHWQSQPVQYEVG